LFSNPILIAVIALSAVWVYLDATQHGIGKNPDGEGAFNMPAGQWAIVTLGLWIIGLPSYLYARKKLIAQAETSQGRWRPRHRRCPRHPRCA